jgi:hypothetical protein
LKNALNTAKKLGIAVDDIFRNSKPEVANVPKNVLSCRFWHQNGKKCPCMPQSQTPLPTPSISSSEILKTEINK